jgi:hypothetical protein
MKCPQCGFDNRTQAKFCPECAHPAAAGAVTQPRFASLVVYTPKHLAEKILTCKSSLEGERDHHEPALATTGKEGGSAKIAGRNLSLV